MERVGRRHRRKMCAFKSRERQWEKPREREEERTMERGEIGVET